MAVVSESKAILVITLLALTGLHCKLRRDRAGSLQALCYYLLLHYVIVVCVKTIRLQGGLQTGKWAALIGINLSAQGGVLGQHWPDFPELSVFYRIPD